MGSNHIHLGPGAYEAKAGDRGPAFTMRSATARLGPDPGEAGLDSPGPAHYDAAWSSLRDGPAFTMRGKVKDAEAEVGLEFASRVGG